MRGQGVSASGHLADARQRDGDYVPAPRHVRGAEQRTRGSASVSPSGVAVKVLLRSASSGDDVLLLFVPTRARTGKGTPRQLGDADLWFLYDDDDEEEDVELEDELDVADTLLSLFQQEAAAPPAGSRRVKREAKRARYGEQYETDGEEGEEDAADGLDDDDEDYVVAGAGEGRQQQHHHHMLKQQQQQQQRQQQQQQQQQRGADRRGRGGAVVPTVAAAPAVARREAGAAPGRGGDARSATRPQEQLQPQPQPQQAPAKRPRYHEDGYDGTDANAAAAATAEQYAAARASQQQQQQQQHGAYRQDPRAPAYAPNGGGPHPAASYIPAAGSSSGRGMQYGADMHPAPGRPVGGPGGYMHAPPRYGPPYPSGVPGGYAVYPPGGGYSHAMGPGYTRDGPASGKMLPIRPQAQMPAGASAQQQPHPHHLPYGHPAAQMMYHSGPPPSLWQQHPQHQHHQQQQHPSQGGALHVYIAHMIERMEREKHDQARQQEFLLQQQQLQQQQQQQQARDPSPEQAPSTSGPIGAGDAGASEPPPQQQQQQQQQQQSSSRAIHDAIALSSAPSSISREPVTTAMYGPTASMDRAHPHPHPHYLHGPGNVPVPPHYALPPQAAAMLMGGGRPTGGPPLQVQLSHSGPMGSGGAAGPALASPGGATPTPMTPGGGAPGIPLGMHPGAMGMLPGMPLMGPPGMVAYPRSTASLQMGPGGMSYPPAMLGPRDGGYDSLANLARIQQQQQQHPAPGGGGGGPMFNMDVLKQFAEMINHSSAALVSNGAALRSSMPEVAAMPPHEHDSKMTRPSMLQR